MLVPFQGKCRSAALRGQIPDQSIPAAVVLIDEWADRLRHPGRLDIAKMLTELRGEREEIDKAILTLERLAQGRGERRENPPAWMTAETDSAPKRRGRQSVSRNKPKDPPSD